MRVVHSVELLSEYLKIVGYNLLSLGDLGTLFYYFTVFLKVFMDDGLGGVAVVALDLPDVLPLEVNRLELPNLGHLFGFLGLYFYCWDLSCRLEIAFAAEEWGCVRIQTVDFWGEGQGCLQLFYFVFLVYFISQRWFASPWNEFHTFVLIFQEDVGVDAREMFGWFAVEEGWGQMFFWSVLLENREEMFLYWLLWNFAFIICFAFGFLLVFIEVPFYFFLFRLFIFEIFHLAGCISDSHFLKIFVMAFCFLFWLYFCFVFDDIFERLAGVWKIYGLVFFVMHFWRGELYVLLDGRVEGLNGMTLDGSFGNERGLGVLFGRRGDGQVIWYFVFFLNTIRWHFHMSPIYPQRYWSSNYGPECYYCRKEWGWFMMESRWK